MVFGVISGNVECITFPTDNCGRFVGMVLAVFDFKLRDMLDNSFWK